MKMEPDSFQLCPVTGPEAQTETQVMLFEHQETLFHCEGNWALAQVAHSTGRISHFGYMQKVCSWSWATSSRWPCL